MTDEARVAMVEAERNGHQPVPLMDGRWAEGGPVDPRNHPAAEPAVIVDADAGIVSTSRRKCALVGYASSTRGLAPYHDPAWLIVGLNQLYRMIPRADLWFEIHNRPMFEADIVRDTDYVGWLRRCPIPIMMVERFPDIPHAVRYPLEALVQHYRRDYFTSSPALMMAWAISMGFEEIGIWGIDLVVGREYFFEKACLEYWIGQAEGRGIRVTIPEASALLTQSHRYGYQTEPTYGPFTESYFAGRLKAMAEERNVLLTKLNAMEGAMQELDLQRERLVLYGRGAAVE